VRLSLPITRTLGILLKAKSLGLSEAVTPLIQTLLEYGFRLSATVVAETLTLAGE